MVDQLAQLALFVSDDVETPAAVEARRFRPLSQVWTPEALSRYFLLSSDDLAQIKQCRGTANRLGFALHLVLLRFLHVAVPTLERVPDAIIHFVSLQLDAPPTALAAYPQRVQTRDDHLTQIRTYLGLRPFASTDTDALRAYLVQRAHHRDDSSVLLAEAEDWLRRANILFPALSTLHRLIGEAQTLADDALYQTLVRQLQPAHITALDSLLDRSQGRRGSIFAWLKEASPQASVAAMQELLQKRATIHTTNVLTIDLSVLNRNRVRQLAQLGQMYFAPALKRFAHAKKHSILVALLQERNLAITDDIIEMLDVLIGRIFAHAEEDRDKLFKEQGKQINANLILFRRVAQKLLDAAIPDDQVRTQTFEIISKAQLQQAYDNSAVLVQPDDYNVFAFLTTRYSHLRAFFTDVLQAITFTGTTSAQHVLTALTFLKSLDATKPKWKKLPPETPLTFVDDRWLTAVCPQPGVIDHRLWILCLANQLRCLLRSSDILVAGSRQHQQWDSYLHPPAVWAARKANWFGEWHATLDVDRYLDDLAERFDTTVSRVATTWETNTFAKIEDEKLALTRDEKIALPTSAKVLRDAIVALLPRIKLPALLIEVDTWVRYRQHFTHPNADQGQPWPVRDPALDPSLFAIMLAQGCNLPLSTMAEAATLPYHHLIHTADWYFREATVRQAIIALVDYHHSLPLAATFGPGTSAMSDGIRFGVTARSLYARSNPRLPTRTRGVTVYDMTSDQGSQVYIDIIRCDIRESAAVLDATLHHETELPLKEHFTDTHGYTELIFGLFELESRIFSPRIRDLPSQVLYPMARHHREGTLGALFRGPTINRERIRAHWDEMHRVAASLQDGTVTAQLLVSKLQALKQQRGAHTGIQELGRIFKTLSALTYISDQDYRRRIHHTLNKGELLHALAREVFFGQQGLFRERDYVGQLNRATCMSLIINAIVVWNTRYMMAALDHLRNTGVVIHDADLKHVTPLLWEHITFHGSYHFDLGEPNRRTGLRPLRIQTDQRQNQ